MNYNKLLLDELRFVSFEKSDDELTDELLAKAVTLAYSELLTKGTGGKKP